MHRLTLLASFLLASAMSAAPAGAATTTPGPVIAVLDSGVDVAHPAFKGALWRNPREKRNGVDDDGNGFADDLNGADLVDRDGDPRDGHGHGTHVAGIAARGGGVRIMAVRVLGDDCSGTGAHLAEGIDYAVANGARVINLSLGGYAPKPAIADALGRAEAAGVFVVASAGNDGTDLDLTPMYPASYRTAGMLVVGAAERDGQLAPFSGRGARTVDLVAPGVAVRSALPGRRSGLYTGTSQAVPAVSRTVALAIARAPAASIAAIRASVLGGVVAVRSLFGSVASGGKLGRTRPTSGPRR